MTQIHEHSAELSMRTPHEVMQLQRLGCHYPTRLSFMRVLTRRMLGQKWLIKPHTLNLDENGAGDIIYSVQTPNALFTFVAFSQALEDVRSNREIDSQWDLTATLCAGQVDREHLKMLKANVPKQEAGRLDSRSLALTRANKTSRNFDYVVGRLAQGKQPETSELAKEGYLYKTTAVYGSGKYGMCDWEQVRNIYRDFARPFAAEMFSCFMLRQASFDVAEHMARVRSPSKAVQLEPATKRYMGIGNATGLGMAPFLICHPVLINQWITCRETALARIKAEGEITAINRVRLASILTRAQQHLNEIDTANKPQNSINHQSARELGKLTPGVRANDYVSWEELLESTNSLSMDTQEILFSCLIEIFPELVDDLADAADANETFRVKPEQTLRKLKTTLEQHYDWALNIDFDNPNSRAVFWYRTAEKTEPSLGRANVDEGADRQLHVDVARQAYELHEHICDHVERNPTDLVAHFLINYPSLRYIVSRVQTMAATRYGEIRANVLDIDITPTELMRCKLAYLGASNYDPESRVWMINTLFQGAPIVEDVNKSAEASVVDLNESTTTNENRFDDWSFPLMPTSNNATVE
ncbi:MAG: hypothetical protein AB8G18_05610 [Gammaproteobacteria bacterium]